jgi:hypothetical protein
MNNNADILIVSIALSIAIFVLLREVFCWYFKINRRISLLSDIKDELVQANRYANESKDLSGLVLSRTEFSELSVKERKDFFKAGGFITEDTSISDKRKSTFWREK